MAALPLEVADIFNDHGRAYRQANAESLSRTQRRVMSAIELCRTAALGGHLERCDNCGHERNAFNSCRNRHCPKCQSLARARWLEAREAELLECEYFHVVFTMPQELAAIAFQNKRLVYDILFRCVTETLISIAADPKHLRPDRLPHHLAYLGSKFDASPPSTLCGARRRIIGRWHALDRLSYGVFLAGACALTFISPPVLGAATHCV